MDIMLIVVILAILLLVAAIVHYQWQAKEHQKRLFGKGVEEQEIISLDEDDGHKANYEPPPSKTFIMGAMGILVVVFFYYIFFYTPPGPDGDFTYDEYGMRALCEKLVADKRFPVGTRALLLLPPYMLNDYLQVEEGKDHPFVDEILVDTVLTKGMRFTIIGIDSSAPFYGVRSADADYSLTPTTLRDLLRKYENVQVVISLGGYTRETTSVGAQDRSFYLAVFGDKPRLTPYLDMAEDRVYDLALLSKGAYNISQTAPDTMPPEEIVDTHFLFISPENARHVRNSYRQYIGVFPPENNAFCQ